VTDLPRDLSRGFDFRTFPSTRDFRFDMVLCTVIFRGICCLISENIVKSDPLLAGGIVVEAGAVVAVMICVVLVVTFLTYWPSRGSVVSKAIR
jgi:hypothetical protein